VSAARAVAIAIAALLATTTGARIGVYALAVVTAVAAVLFRPVHSALLPSLCHTPHELASANVVRGILDAIATLIGPALAALFLARGGVAAVFAAAAIASAIAALLLLGLRPETAAAAGDERPSGSHLVAGFRVVGRSRDLSVLIGLTALQTLTRGAIAVFVVVVAIDVLHIGESGVGTLTAAIGAGAVVGSLVTTLLVGTRRLARWFGIGVALWGLPLALLALWPNEPAALVLLAVVGVGNALVDIGLFTLIARRAPDAVLESGGAAGVAAGALLAPLVIALAGTRTALAVLGLLAPVAVAATWWMLRALDVTVTHQDDEVELLRAVPTFALLPLPAVEQLVRGLEPVTVDPGDLVFAQGDAGDRFFVIVSGSAEVLGDGVEIATLGPGDGFGDIALLRQVPRTATVRALTDLQLMALTGQRFVAVVTSFRPSAAAATTHAEAMLDRFAPPA
jgi:predicted MFS family arabinose efflux permease